MSGFKNPYPNLPGMLVEFKDGGLQLKVEANPPATKSILILGTAVDGPVMEPVAVDPTTAAALFGTAVSANGIPNGATLVPALEEAWIGGCRDIRLMRVSGKEAEVALKGNMVNDTIVEIHEQELGVSAGNEETTLTVENTPLVPGSVLVKASGANVTTGIIVDEATGDVLIGANSCAAGAALSVEYSYKEKDDFVEAALAVATDVITTMYDVNEITTITRAGSDPAVTVAADQYTFDGKEITFIGGAVDSDAVAIADTDTFDVAYNGFTGSVIQAEENGDVDGQWTAETAVQEFNLDFAPVPGSVHLYANESEVLDTVAFTVDGSTQKLGIKKEYFGVGEILKVSYSHNVDRSFAPELVLRSTFGGSIYNNCAAEVVDVLDSNDDVVGKELVIYKPEGKKAQVSEQPMRFSSLVYPNLRLLNEAINAAGLNNICVAESANETTLTSELVAIPKKYFAGGQDGLGLSDLEMYEALGGTRNAEGFIVNQGAYQLLEDYHTDYVYVAGVYADTKLPGKFQNFAYDLAMFTAILSFRTSTTHGLISMKPAADTGLKGIQDYVKALKDFKNDWFMRDLAGNLVKDSETGGNVDIGSYVSIIAGPAVYISVPSLGTVATDGGLLYAAMNTVLAPQSAPTNKTLPGARSLKHRFSNAQLNDIIGNRMVTFKTKDDGTVVVVDAMTAAQAGSDYARLTTAKVVKETVDELRLTCDPFIGEPNSIEQRNAMSALIEKKLTGLKNAGVIQDYEFQVIATPIMQLLGEAQIELTLVPPQELRKITTVVSLSPSL